MDGWTRKAAIVVSEGVLILMAKVNLAKILSGLGKRAVPNLFAFAFTLQLRKVTETSVKLAE
jgi:hypothetical protein